MKILRFTIFMGLLFSGISYGQAYADKIDITLDNTNAITKGKIEDENGIYKLYFYDKYEKDSIVTYFQDKGYQGGGASWLALVYTAFSSYEENLIDLIKYDIEGAGITFESDNKEDLTTIAKVIGLIKTDKTVLDSLVEEAVKLQIMK